MNDKLLQHVLNNVKRKATQALQMYSEKVKENEKEQGAHKKS